MGWFQQVAGWVRRSVSSGPVTGPTSPSTSGPTSGPSRPPARGPRVSGEPPSANGASSFHLGWELPGEFVAVHVTLEIVEPPTVDRLYFWALQVDFTDNGRAAGGAHLGLQYHPQYPGRTAVNWGGYDPAGQILAGTTSRLAGAIGNPHTRNLAWKPGRPYRLGVELAPPGEQPADGRTAWRGTVVDLIDGTTVVVRDLLPRGRRLVRPMVWSEVFARCDHPPVRVQWSDLEASTDDGRRLRPRVTVTNYQRPEDGGCANTNSWVEGTALVQRTNTDRTTAQGTRLALGGGDP